MKKISLVSRYIYILVFTIFAMFVFVLNINIQDISASNDSFYIYNFFLELWLSFKEFDISNVVLLFLIFCFFNDVYFDGKKVSVLNVIISFVLTFITIVGESYKIDNTLNLIFSSIAQMVKCFSISFGYFLLYYAAIKKVRGFKLDFKVNKENKKLRKIQNFISKFQLPIFIIILLLGWIPYIIYFYPGASTGDTFDCLCQFFHLNDSWSVHTINLLSEDMYINKHHSFLFTVLLGSIFKLGYINDTYTLGAFMYTLFQVLLVLLVILFLMYYMKKIKVPLWIRLFSICFLAFTPVVGGYIITAVKDTPSAVFTFLYVIFLFQIIRNYDSIFLNKKRLVCFVIVMLLVMMFRNNGIYTVVFSFPLLLLVYKKNFEKIVMTFLVTLVIFCLYDKVLLTSLNVTNGSIKEVLTIPFMQVARVAHFKEDAFSDSEIEVIDNVLEYSVIKGYYDPNLADNVKDSYDKDTSSKDLVSFFFLWGKYFFKYPIVYVESFINSTYGYFFPEVGEKYASLLVDNRVNKGTYFNISEIKKFDDEREFIELVNKIGTVFPVLFLFNHAAFYDWLLIFSIIYIILRKKYKYLVPLVPLVVVLLVCLASPVNGAFRYILPIVFSVPIILVIDYFVYVECENEKKL